MKLIKIFTSMFFLILAILAVSWHLKVLFLYLLFLTLRKYLPYYNNHRKQFIYSALTLFFLIFILTFPNRETNKSDYIRSIYFHKQTKEVLPEPIIPYLTNIISEGDIMQTVTLAAKVISPDIFGQGRSNAIRDVLSYMHQTSMTENNFVQPYRELARKGTPPHNVPFQIAKQQGLYLDTEHYFLYIPEGKKPENCEVVVFCHGYSGNWLLYTELFAQYSDVIVIAVETPDFTGNFTKDIMQYIIRTTLPHAFDQIGIPFKKSNLIGLSNGGTAVNNAIHFFPDQFKSYTIISAPLYSVPETRLDVNIIYGENDKSGGVNRNIPENKYNRYIIKGEDHTLLVSSPDTVFGLINKIIHQ